ncbi:alpha/beta-hydrolase, partial [Aureobasidium melanogenum]
MRQFKFYGALAAATTLFAGGSFAQAPPPPHGLTYINSTVYPGASISFKETTICETNEGVRGWSGYVNLPPSPREGRNYPIHTWFWFFEARHDPENAPLSLWLQGGPDAPTSISAVNENGPCNLLNNSRDAVNNPWSWNDRVNMLYIDQPVQTGFSYDTLVNGTIYEAKSPFVVLPAQVPKNDTSLAGVFSSGNSSLAPNSTMAVAPPMWDFMQIWLKDFPGYSGDKEKFSIWGESYGGHWVPTFADYFYKQNDLISSGHLNATSLTIESLGLINACVDAETQIPFYPVMAANNTYGIKVFNDTTYAGSTAALPKCLNLTKTCRNLASRLDSEGWGNNTDVNNACGSAYLYCFYAVARETQLGNIEGHDIWGFRLIFTGFSSVIAQEFAAAGDFLKGNNLAALGQLLDRGVKLSLLYGDRDYQCNWFGGEAISLAINSSISSSFGKAGYTKFETNASYTGGLTRQYGNLSFTRVFQAGHEVSYYQPETTYQIFNRVMFDRDVATGQIPTAPASNSSTYATSGNSSALVSIGVPMEFESSVPSCYFWDIMETCTPAQAQVFANGSAITEDFILVGYMLKDGTKVFYNQTAAGAGNGSSPQSEDQSAFVSEQESFSLHNINVFPCQLQQKGRSITLYTMALIDVPVSDQVVDVFAIDTGAILDVPTSTFIKPVYQGSERLHCPAYVFLIKHTSGRQVLFDLGLRHDWMNLPPQKVEAINRNGWRITAGKPLTEVLAEHGIDVAQGAIDAVIWSHPHLDHVGDVSVFPKTTTLVVGKGFKTEHMPGYPLNSSSGVWNSDFEGRDVQQIDFGESLTIGGFPAHDFFGDGSFFLLDTPGHMKSHMCGLVRVSADPPRFVFMGGDIAHHPGQIRPSSHCPLPVSRPSLRVVGSDKNVKTSDSGLEEPFYEPSPGVHHDLNILQESLGSVRKFDGDDRFLILLAHDSSVLHPPRKILLVVTTGGFTHAAPVLEIGRALASRGHTIEFATLEGQEHWIANNESSFVTKVHFLGPSPTKGQLDGHYKRMQQWDIAKGIGQAMESKYLWDSWWPKTYHGLKAIMDDSATRPDLMIADFFVEAVTDIHVEYKLPIAMVAPNMPSFMMPCSYIPGQPGFQLEGTTTSEHASLWLRICNELFFLPDLPAIFEMIRRTKHMRKDNGVFRPPHKPIKPDYLVFVNSFFGLEIPRDLPPTCAPVGPLLSPTYPPLDTSYMTFLESHSKVLYIALGTHIVLQTKDTVKVIEGVFRLMEESLIDGVIWAIAEHGRKDLDRDQRFHGDSDISLGQLLENNHSNFLFSTFAPQRAILEHKSVVLYFTHGGGSSANEALYHGKPMISMGFFADQIANTARLVEAGVAESLNKFSFTSNELYTKAKKILEGDSGTYQRNVLRLKRIAHVAARRKEHAADLVEELLYDNELRLDDTGTRELRPMHLQTADMRMSAYKAKNWDLYGIGVLSIVGVVGLTGLTGQLVWSHRDLMKVKSRVIIPSS